MCKVNEYVLVEKSRYSLSRDRLTRQVYAIWYVFFLSYVIVELLSHVSQFIICLHLVQRHWIYELDVACIIFKVHSTSNKLFFHQPVKCNRSIFYKNLFFPYVDRISASVESSRPLCNLIFTHTHILLLPILNRAVAGNFNICFKRLVFASW